MPKTITVRIDDNVYELFKKAAAGQKRTISNYLEYATLNYLIGDSIVSDLEMDEIMAFEKDIEKGLSDVYAGRYKIVD